MRMEILNSSRIHYIALLIFTAAGSFLRFHELSEQSLWIDEGFSLVVAQAIAEKGLPRLPDGSLSWSHFPTHYLMSFGGLLFQTIEVGARFFSALAGTLLIIALFFLTKRLVRCPWSALIAAALLAVLTYEIDWSRQARFYVILQLWIVTAMLFFLHFLDNQKKMILAVSFIFAFLAVATHPAGYLAFLFMGLTKLMQTDTVIFRSGWLKLHWRWFAVTLIFLCLGFLLMSLSGSNSGLYQTLQRLGRSHDVEYIGLYLFFFNAQFGFLLFWAAFGSLLATFKMPKSIIPLLLCIAAYFVVISWYTMLFHFRYALPIFVFIPLFIGYGIVAPVRWLLKNHTRARVAASILLCLLFSASLFSARISLAVQPHPDLGFTAPLVDWRGAMSWIKDDHLRTGGNWDTLVTVSPFPMFHDFYIGGSGKKYFLPHSLSGFPGHERWYDPYSVAENIYHYEHLVKVEHGYLYLDKFGLNMLLDQEISITLLKIRPIHIIVSPRGFDTYIWKLPIIS